MTYNNVVFLKDLQKAFIVRNWDNLLQFSFHSPNVNVPFDSLVMAVSLMILMSRKSSSVFICINSFGTLYIKMSDTYSESL